MANTTIQIKKSATPSATPTSLEFGELAINYADGKLFYKAANGTIYSIVADPYSFSTVNANNTLIVADVAEDILSLVPGDFITITGDSINDRITIGANVKSVYDTANAALPNTTGAVFNGNLNIKTDLWIGNNITNVKSVIFDTSTNRTPSSRGELTWSQDESTLRFEMENAVINHIGQDLYYYVKNQTGATINIGTVVRFAGTLGSSGRLLIAPAIANNSLPSKYVVGVTAETIADGADGFVLSQGKIRGINTSMFSEGDILYLSATTPGAFSNTMPTAPNNKVTVAAVVKKDNNQGTIEVRTTFGSKLNEDELVELNGLANGHVITYVSATGRFENSGVLVSGYNTTNAAFGLSNNVYAAVNSAFAVINAAYTSSNADYTLTNAAYTSANANYVVTNAAFTQSNTDNVRLSAAYVSLNAAFAVANAAYGNANSVAISANAYAGFMSNSGNAFARTIVDANLIVARAYTNTSTDAANNYAGVMANAANAIASATYATQTSLSTGLTSANNYAGAMANSGNVFSGLVYTAVNSAFAVINAAFTSSNADYTLTNAAYTSANANYVVTNAAFAVANAAYGNANSISMAANNYAGAMVNAANAYANSTYVKLSSSSQTISGDISITGNLNILGTTVTHNTDSFVVRDPLVLLASNNTADIVDIGFIAHYANATNDIVHTGFFRDHESKEWFIFKEYNVHALDYDGHIGTTGNNFTVDVLNASLRTSNLNLGGANAIVWIKSAFDTVNAAYTSSNADYVLTNAAFNSVNSVAIAANNYAGAMANASNTFARTIVDANLVVARAYTNTSTTAANNYAGAMANSGNSWATATFATISTVATNATAANNYAGAMANSGNAWATATFATISTVATNATSANNYAGVMANSGNSWATATFATITTVATNATAANNYAGAMANSGNAYTVTVGAAGNAYANVVGTSANNYAGAMANAANAIASATYATQSSLSTGLTSANNYAGAMANSGNAWTQTIVDANLVTSRAYTNTSTTAANNYAGVMANSSNAYTVTVGAAANAYVNVVGTSANNYAGAMANASNTFARTIVDANLIVARAYTNTSTTSANNYAGAMANSGNAWATATFATISTVATNATSANNYAGAMANSGNAYAATVGTSTNAYSVATFATITNAAAAFAFANGVATNVTAAFAAANAEFTFSNTIYAAVNSAFAVINAAYTSSNADYVLTNAAFNSVNSVATSANNYAGAMANASNTFARTIVDANLIVSRAYTNTSTTSANNYAGAMANAANAVASATYAPKASPTFTGTVSMTANISNQTLTYGTFFDWNLNNGQVATITLTGNATANAPTNMKVGTYILHVIQDATGNRTITWNSVYKWPAAIAPTLTATGNRRDIISFVCDGTNMYGSFLPDVR
jgi:hypothetical protein